MFNLIGITLASFLAALSGAVVPGPVFALVVSKSLGGSRAAGPLIILGHLVIECVIIFAVFLGLGPLLGSASARIVVKYVGGAVLALMGIMLAKDALNMKDRNIEVGVGPAVSANAARSSFFNLAFSGLLASCSNPYFFLWWLEIGVPTMLGSMSVAGFLGFFSFIAGHAAADFSWFSFIGYSAYKGKNMLSWRIIRLLIFVSAAFLVGFAFYMLLVPVA
ncbi:MAG: LysE family translocator [Candidatus Bathyarchaeota archaeon]|nr:LysE family translocator [Candidatus Bathyarchaeota archaeon]